MNVIPRPTETVFLTEPYNNQPTSRPDDFAGVGGNLDWFRHFERDVNILFLDGRVDVFESKNVASCITQGDPPYGRTRPTLVWGPF